MRCVKLHSRCKASPFGSKGSCEKWEKRGSGDDGGGGIGAVALLWYQ